MPTLLPNLTDALRVHDAAHTEQSAELHDTALKLLALAGQKHICVDALDTGRDQTWFDALPGIVCLDAEAVAIAGDKALVGTEDFAETVSTHLAWAGQVMHDAAFTYKRRTPAYGLYLVRQEEAEQVEPVCDFKYGEYVPVGYPRKHGTYRFPVVAQVVPEEYRMLQVHKDGDRVTIFEHDGAPARGLAAVIDSFVAMDSPQQAIFLCLYHEAGVELFDVLMVDGVDFTKTQLADRLDWIAGLMGQVADCGLLVPTCHAVQDASDLPKIEPGRYIVRHKYEVLSDLMRPYWFEYEVGRVGIGRVLPWCMPTKTVKDGSGYIVVPDTGLPPMQIHRQHGEVKIFVAQGGRNRANCMPQVVEMAKRLPENFIMECMWTVDRKGVPVSVKAVKSAWYDLSDCDIRLYPYDLIMWGDDDLSQQPMYERVELLEKIVADWAGAELGVADEADKAWLFVADSVRPLDGSNEHILRLE